MARILIIDDNETMREGMAATVRRMGHEAVLAAVGRGGPGAAAPTRQAPPTSSSPTSRWRGWAAWRSSRRVRELDPDCPVMIVTAFGTVETAVEAMRLGAIDFLQKPFAPEVLRLKVERALELRREKRGRERAEAEIEALRADAALPYRFGEIVGETPAMRALFQTIEKVAPTDASVCIHGESGTGKELVARAIHARSKRAGGPVREGELRRARRDAARVRAVRAREGRVHRRDQAQARPLRAGRRGHAVPRRDRRHDARPADQAAARAAGARVRARGRRGDDQGRRARHLRHPPRPQGRGGGGPLPRGPLLPAARRARARAAAARAPGGHPAPGRALHRQARPAHQRRRSSGIDDAALARLCAYRWPGNVRELENVDRAGAGVRRGRDDRRRRAAARSCAAALPDNALAVPAGETPLPEILEDLERQLIQRAYDKSAA